MVRKNYKVIFFFLKKGREEEKGRKERVKISELKKQKKQENCKGNVGIDFLGKIGNLNFWKL